MKGSVNSQRFSFILCVSCVRDADFREVDSGRQRRSKSTKMSKVKRRRSTSHAGILNAQMRYTRFLEIHLLFGISNKGKGELRGHQFHTQFRDSNGFPAYPEGGEVNWHSVPRGKDLECRLSFFLTLVSTYTLHSEVYLKANRF